MFAALVQVVLEWLIFIAVPVLIAYVVHRIKVRMQVAKQLELATSMGEIQARAHAARRREHYTNVWAFDAVPGFELELRF